VIQSEFHTVGPQILEATVKKLFLPTTWPPGFVYPCSEHQYKSQYAVFFRKHVNINREKKEPTDDTSKDVYSLLD